MKSFTRDSLSEPLMMKMWWAHSTEGSPEHLEDYLLTERVVCHGADKKRETMFD